LSQHGGTLYYHDEAKNWQMFAPNIVFPSASDECLLHLLYSDKPFGGVTARHVWDTTNQGISNSNSSVKSNDGQSLEACSAAAIMCASQYRDAKYELTLDDFITHLTNQLLPINLNAKLTEEARSTLKRFEKGFVPYLMPANTSLCDFYYACIDYLGELERTINKERIDARATCQGIVAFTEEVKDWAGAIDMGKVLARVPEDSPFHIITCNAVPHYSKFAERIDTLIRRVCVKEQVIDFFPIEGCEDPEDPDCFVLIFVLGEMGL